MLKLMEKQQYPHHSSDQSQTEVMFDIVAFQRSFRLPFKRNAKITASAAAADAGGSTATHAEGSTAPHAGDSTAANDAGGIGPGSDHLTVSFR